MMCPDRQLLSVYFDGEVPSPWKEKMEKHVSNCPLCREKLETYKALSFGLADHAEDAAGAEERCRAAQDRVWLSMEQRFRADFSQTPAQGGTAGRVTAPRAMWRRRVSVPIPAAAAAVALFIFSLAFVLGTRVPLTTETPGMAALHGSTETPVMGYLPDPIIPILPDDDFDMPGFIPVSDMSEVLQYLGLRDSGELLIMRLPESRNFVTNGEPAIIRAADYSQRMPIQQIPGQGTQGRRRE